MDTSDIVKMTLYCNGGIPVKKLVLIFINAGHFEIFDNFLLFEQFGLFVKFILNFLVCLKNYWEARLLIIVVYSKPIGSIKIYFH